MMKAGKKNDPKPTRANTDSSTHSAPDRDLVVVMRDKPVESPRVDERREFYRITGNGVIAGKYYPGCGKRNRPVFFSLVRKNQTGAVLPQLVLLRSEALVIAQADHVLEHRRARRQVHRVKEQGIKEVITFRSTVNLAATLKDTGVVLRVVHADHRARVVDRCGASATILEVP